MINKEKADQFLQTGKGKGKKQAKKELAATSTKERMNLPSRRMQIFRLSFTNLVTSFLKSCEIWQLNRHQSKKDLDALDQWWDEQGAKSDRDRHELFASAFETYLMEGKGTNG